MFFRVTRSLRNAKEEAEQASRAKSDFLSMMSHEIRTPMNAVIGLTNYMIGDNPKKGHVDVLNTLKFSAENLLVILNDILDLNKIEANRIEFEKMPVNVRQLTARLKQVFERLADERGLYIKISIDDTITQSILCDSTRTSQVLSNLISNAIKFTKEGGIELIVNELERDGKHITLRFAIKDTGIGISFADQQKIFDSFTQASTSVTREYGGTGLGLTITRRLLNLQGVELGLNSERGKGSEFYFIQRFECVDAEDSPEEDLVQPVDVAVRDANILLVEDNKVNVLVAQKFLKKWGFSIDLAGNGKEALDRVGKKAYDLILMDLQMPVMDGYEASKQIRALGITTPIIALTASTMMEDRDKVKRFGMNDHIIKPFNPDELKHKLNKYITAKGAAK
jgi:CheY-like chemotaxis protein